MPDKKPDKKRMSEGLDEALCIIALNYHQKVNLEDVAFRAPFLL